MPSTCTHLSPPSLTAVGAASVGVLYAMYMSTRLGTVTNRFVTISWVLPEPSCAMLICLQQPYGSVLMAQPRAIGRPVASIDRQHDHRAFDALMR